jgi:TIR domain-containing protein
MEDALASARYVVLCLSGAGNLAPWMSREWMAALALQLQGNDIQLLSVRLPGGTLPVLLADIKYADLANDRDRGVADLLKAIR